MILNRNVQTEMSIIYSLGFYPKQTYKEIHPL